jgi:hypothetical protein
MWVIRRPESVLISWKSKGQKGVTLLSSKAEFVALSKAANKVKFVFQVLRSMGVKVDLPDADNFTKNLLGDLHSRHASKIVGEKQDGTS